MIGANQQIEKYPCITQHDCITISVFVSPLLRGRRLLLVGLELSLYFYEFGEVQEHGEDELENCFWSGEGLNYLLEFVAVEKYEVEDEAEAFHEIQGIWYHWETLELSLLIFLLRALIINEHDKVIRELQEILQNLAQNNFKVFGHVLVLQKRDQGWERDPKYYLRHFLAAFYCVVLFEWNAFELGQIQNLAADLEVIDKNISFLL